MGETIRELRSCLGIMFKTFHKAQLSDGCVSQTIGAMKQQDLGLKLSTQRTRKEVPLDKMSLVMSLVMSCAALIVAHAPMAKTGRPPFDLEMMLRVHCLQQWFGLSDLAAEESLFEMTNYRDFCGLSDSDIVHDRVSILRFRHLLEEHALSLIGKTHSLVHTEVGAAGGIGAPIFCGVVPFAYCATLAAQSDRAVRARTRCRLMPRRL